MDRDFLFTFVPIAPLCFLMGTGWWSALARHGAGKCFIMKPSFLDLSSPPELVYDSFGRFPLKSGLMGGLLNSMWVVLNYSMVNEISQVVAGSRGFEPTSSVTAYI